MNAKHLRRDPTRWVRRYGAAAALLAAAVISVIAINQTSGGSLHRVAGAPQAQLGATPAADPNNAAAVQNLAATVSVSPASGATQITPDSVVTVTSPAGQLTSVTVTAGATPLAGALAPDGHSWRSSAGLLASSTYQVTAAVVDAAGTRATSTSSFRTMAVGSTVSAAVSPSDGSTVGVGQPLVLKFKEPIPAAAQPALLSHLSVAESQPVPGGWHWFSPYELHLRPQAFWPSGEKITLNGDLNGWNLGNGTWGAGNLLDHVTIGDSHVSVANLQSHVMTVTNDGQTVATFPFSAGSTEYPTQDGIHIAMDKEPVVHMVSSTVGIPVHSSAGYDEYVYNDVHISDSGEYVHDAPWSTYAQGSENVSHGCINLGPNDSKTFYNFSNVGDVIEVVGGSRAPDPGDHGVMDWTLDWSQWTPATVTQG